MSSISHKLDAKEIAGGKGKAEGANRADAKKLVDGGVAAVAENGEEVKLSKSELKKQAKKAEKKAAKAGGEENKESAADKKAAHESRKAAKAVSGVQLIVSTTAKHSDSGVDTQQIVANFAKVGLNLVYTEAAEMGEKEYRSKSATGMNFYLTTPEGSVLESSAIARYISSLGEGQLTGATAFERAQVSQWIDFYNSTI